MTAAPILAHGADLLVLPILIGGVVTIMIALKDGQRKHTSIPVLPTHPFGRHVRAAVRAPVPRPSAPQPSARVHSRSTAAPLHAVQGTVRGPETPHWPGMPVPPRRAG